MLRRLFNLFRKHRLDGELDAELRHHLESLEREHRARGLSVEQATLAARRDFGALASTQQAYREQRGLPFLESLWQDIRFGARSLTRSPTVAATVILTLMLGIGANTALFSVIYTVLLKPLPYRDPDRLVWITEYNKRLKFENIPINEALDWRTRAQSFESMATFEMLYPSVTGDTESVKIRTANTSGSLARIFGIAPAIGRDFLPEELERRRLDPGRFVAIVSDRFFRQNLRGDRAALGTILKLGTIPSTIIGVLPPDFRLPLPSANAAQTEVDAIVDYGANSPQVIARLKPGVKIETARTELETLHRASTEFGASESDVRIMPLQEHVVGPTRLALLVLWAAVGCVLLIACVNVTNLLLARSGARVRETAVRAALGAGRVRLMRQLLTESMLLALAGGAGGLLLAFWGIRLLVDGSPIDIPRLRDTALNWNVLIFSLAICAITGILSGLMPALASSHVEFGQTLKQGERTASASSQRRRWNSLLVICELATALILLSSTGLMVKSLWLARSASAALSPEQVLVSSIEGPAFTDLPLQLEALPGVESAGVIAGFNTRWLGIAGEPVPALVRDSSINGGFVTPHYFAASGMHLLAGRGFNDDDPFPVVVNETFVRRFAPTLPNPAAAVGRNLVSENNGTRRTSGLVVGVVTDFRSRPDVGPEPQVFYPPSKKLFAADRGNLFVRTSSDPMAFAGAIRKIVERTPGMSMVGAETLEDRLSAAIAPRRFQAALLVIFAAVAFVLAIVGAYGVLSYSVTERTREIGVRIALGAGRRDVLGMVLARGAKLIFAGVGLGLLGSLTLTRLMSSLLYGVKLTDPWTYAASCLLLAGVAMFAAYLPARRAVRVDPIEALRYE